MVTNIVIKTFGGQTFGCKSKKTVNFFFAQNQFLEAESMRNRLVVTNIVIKTFGGQPFGRKYKKKRLAVILNQLDALLSS